VQVQVQVQEINPMVDSVFQLSQSMPREAASDQAGICPAGGSKGLENAAPIH
jgi:hypothetical protein